ncbi:Uncharacterised protein [Citrobacter freundii]|nr:Uncharacterised protein [Citrobacter freundii]
MSALEKIGRFACQCVKSAPAFGRLLHADCRSHAHRYQRQRQPEAEAQHHGGTQREGFELDANQQYRNGGRAGDQPAGQTKQ